MHMKLFLGKFSFSINSITFVSQLSHIKKIYVPTTVFIVTKVFSSICFQFLLTECSNRVNLQYISRASKMADSDNNQLMNCKNFVTLRNIFNYCTTTRVPKWKDTAVFEFSEEDLWNVHRAESCVVVFCRCQVIYFCSRNISTFIKKATFRRSDQYPHLNIKKLVTRWSRKVQ